MKIAAISPSRSHLQDIGRHLKDGDTPRSVSLHEGGMSKVRVIADQHRPDLIILDGMCREANELSIFEYVSAQYPQTVVILLCANHTPEFLINAMRVGIREVLQSPVTKDALLAAVGRIEQRLGVVVKPKLAGQVLAFIPCKGGSGSTFIAANLGYQLATEGKKVLLIDLNLQFGDAVLFVHDHKPATNIGEIALNIHRLDASLLAASLVNVTPNFGVLAAPEDPGHAIEVKPEHIDVLLNLASSHYDFVILDLSRTLDAITIKALDRANQIYPVLQLTLPFVRDATRLLAAFKTLGYPKDKVRIVVNRYDKSSEIKLSDVGRTLNMRPFVTIPNNYEVVATAVNHGKPVATFAKNSAVAKSLQDFAQELGLPAQQESSLLSRLFGRA